MSQETTHNPPNVDPVLWSLPEKEPFLPGPGCPGI